MERLEARQVKRIYLTGYRSFELAVFQENDPKIKVIKNILKRELTGLIENGLEWLILSGNLGIEFWAFEVALELKVDYPDFSIGVFFPFADFGQQWNDKNKEKLTIMTAKADYVNHVSQKPYDSPQQLKNHTQFLLNKTMGCLLVYDEEFPGKTSYFFNDAKKHAENHEYQVLQITMDDLQYYED